MPSKHVVKISLAVAAVGAFALEPATAQIPNPFQGTAAVTPEAVRQVLQAVEAAGQSKNIDEVLKYVAPFATLESTLEGIGYSQTTRVIGKEQIRARLLESLERLQSSEYLDKEQKIDIIDNGQAAIVSNDTIVGATLKDGRRLIINGRDTYVLGQVGGQLMLTAGVSSRSADVRPAADKPASK
ncbi:hypothetical protein [Gloeobacter morelensis]|uniref:FlgO domain-containing protein n=1 Tax=Gloeobacter morelensis MG652769 TaxID=2781736 RepID=A0ABY3PHD8_9CYAN|nr:hypothetical protein [Gloeobacter morelensis]UFP93049.1 hypothetical protein ISF26_14665 [Gloeobacter morelensis MG652769]